jgi:MFS family permease
MLGASAAMLGLIEGAAEATAQISKLFSGVLSDRWHNRKGLALAGYGLAAVVKPLFPLAESVIAVFIARLSDRIGKGIRGAPRDAMVADMTPSRMRGAAFGLRQSLDTIGAFMGPLIAIGLMSLFLADLRIVLWVACIPALVAVAILAFGVSEPKQVERSTRKSGFDPATMRRLGSMFWIVAGFGAAMMLARFSEAFLVLKASAAGLSLTFVPLVMVVMSAVYAFSSYPAGVVSDHYGRRGLLAVGLAVLIAADIVLALASSVTLVMAGVALWGLHMGLTQGVLSTFVADAAPADLRGTGFGAFNLVSGTAALLASVIAGVLWDAWGPAPVFLTGAVFAGLALVGSTWMKSGQNSHAAG